MGLNVQHWWGWRDRLAEKLAERCCQGKSHGDGSVTQHQHPILPPSLLVVFFVFDLITRVSLASVSRCPYIEHREPGRWVLAHRGRKLTLPFSGTKSFCFLLFITFFFFFWDDLTVQPRLPLSLRSSCLSHASSWDYGQTSPRLAGPWLCVRTDCLMLLEVTCSS